MRHSGASLKLVSNVDHIIAIEYLLAAQALAFHGESQLAAGTRRAWQHLRQIVERWQKDRWLASDIACAVAQIKAHRADALVG